MLSSTSSPSLYLYFPPIDCRLVIHPVFYYGYIDVIHLIEIIHSASLTSSRLHCARDLRGELDLDHDDLRSSWKGIANLVSLLVHIVVHSALH